MPSISDAVMEKLHGYEFDTFLIGASIPQSILDREDELRSRFKIKGHEGIKTQTTKFLSKKINFYLKKRIDYSRPDLTILVSLAEKTFTIIPRALWMSGRYQKFDRGIPQRSVLCNICNGLGCAQCNYEGRSPKSVQGIITAVLVKMFDAESCNFVWLGSEDENSLVEGSGRPFYVEIIKPKKRGMRAIEKSSGFKINKERRAVRLNGIRISKMQLLNTKVTVVPQFEIVASINLLRKPGGATLDEAQVETVESKFSHLWATVRLSRKLRAVRKRIESIKLEVLENGNVIHMNVMCDGGIPLKKLVNGIDNSVEPNLSEALLGYEIDPRRPFDILDVRIKKIQAPASHQLQKEWELSDSA
ncbi:MAG: hypothetical protein OK457_01065 [Thaumarchaeota archaeon]|nr:hypothetical protein [Nitrososphaerota archaeon]